MILQRYPDQVRVLELDARPLRPVVDQHVGPGVRRGGDPARQQVASVSWGSSRQTRTWKGAIAHGHMIPSASWLCSITACIVRLMPMP